MTFCKRLILPILLLTMCVEDSQGQTMHKTPGVATNPFVAKQKRAPVVGNDKYTSFRSEIAKLGPKLAQLRVPLRANEKQSPDIFQASEVMRLKEINGGAVDVVFDERGSLPIFMKGRKLQRRAIDPVNARTLSGKTQLAASFLNESRTMLRLQDPAVEMRQTETTVDRLGMTHIRYQQMYKGFEVWGYDAKVHLSAAGNVESYNGRTIPTPTIVDRQSERITEEDAIGRAARSVGIRAVRSRGIRVIDLGNDREARKCWMVNIRGKLEENWNVFVDMETGEVLRSYNNVFYDGSVNGTGTDLSNQPRGIKLYQVGATLYMIDASKAMFNAGASTLPQDGKGVIYTLDAKHADSSLFFVTAANPTTWPDKASVSASFNSSKVYDFYKTVYNRDAIDGTGSTMNVVVNYKTNFNNAFWNGQYMVFGNGDGVAFSDLAASLDVTAHEMTHGVVERTANLVYENQSGALNESFADVFGVLFEFWADPTNANWFLGENITTPGTAGDVLRRLDDPGAVNIAFSGQQPAHMSQFQNLPNTNEGDHGGVHVNSGIPNKAFYLLANTGGVTKEEAGQIYYRALSNYLTRNAQFIDCRLAVIKAAEDLYGGPGNAKAVAAADAFTAVGIGTGSATPPPPVQPPVTGNNYLAVIDAATGLLYRSSTTGTGLMPLTAGALWGRPTATDDGSLIFYVDINTNLHVVQSDGTNDQALTTGGGFNNISVSPNGRYLAVTSTFAEPRIYLFDLQNSSGDKVLQLYTPTYTEGVSAGNIQFSDRVDWMSNSQVVMYDAYNIAVNATDTVGSWDINLIRVSDTAIARLFPPQPRGVNIGNAVFASNSDNKIAFDYLAEGDSVRVFAVDLNTGATGQVTNNLNSLGSPSFSNNDQAIFYHYIASPTVQIYTVGLAADGITGLNNDAVILNGGVYPLAFSIGTRATGIEEQNHIPAAFGLSEAYPNPFNPETNFGFRIAEFGFVKLSAYDLLGREVAVLVHEERPAGTYTVPFHANGLTSGVYIVRLQSGGMDAVRRVMLVR